MAASPQQKFDAAVKVIRGLPKNGSFQPSNEMMLKFYAYYKQATEGPCTSPKPGMWNMVNRKKWEAWAELGPMERETAMLHYVDELKHIVEIMPQTEQVAQFVDTLGSFYEVIEEEVTGSEVGGSPVKVAKQPNGSAQLNGSGDENMENETEQRELRLPGGKDSRPDRPNGEGDSIVPHSSNSGLGLAVNGVSTSGHKDPIEDEDTEEEEDDDDDDDDGKDKKHEDSARTTPQDSGSEGEEFCDTSDHVEQVLQVDTSTPAVQRSSNTRVHFAPDVSVAEDSVTSDGDHGNDLSAALQDMSILSSQMESERLNLWTDSEFSYLPRAAELPAQQLTESLHVNSSFSSLISLAGSESVAAGSEEVDREDSPVEAERTSSPQWQMVTCRGGGDEKDGGGHTPRSTERTAAGPSSAGGRAGSQTDSSGISRGRRTLFPTGSGGGGHGGHGQGSRVGSVDEQILVTLLHLQQDLVSIGHRLATLEVSVHLQREEQAKKEKESKLWPFRGLSKKWVVFLLAWPVVTPLLINLFCARRRSVPR